VSSVVIVDWLGRGGIAQTSQEWIDALRAAGTDVTVVTRPGRELVGETATEVSGRVRAHRAVAQQAARVIADVQPDVVVVQNFVLPMFERRVYAAAARVRARTVVVMHDHRLHSAAAGTRAGLRAILRAADTVVAHSHFVADAVTEWTARPVMTIPLPIIHSVVDAPAVPPPFVVDRRPVALHFGVLKRGYKGTDAVLAMAAQEPPGWRFEFVGNDGYVSNATLGAAVRASQVTLLPYRIATQSGAVMLAQAMGSVAVATAVGGIPEQIENGVTGVLLPATADTPQWIATLEVLSDEATRDAIAQRARTKVQHDHAAFVAAVRRLGGADG
jgi:glycosyltransferase involved in cell wall biosynthesis